jgi:hypothetical protein
MVDTLAFRGSMNFLIARGLQIKISGGAWYKTEKIHYLFHRYGSLSHVRRF